MTRSPAEERQWMVERIRALEGALSDLVSWFDGGPSEHGPWIIKAGAYGADDAVKAARAVLTNTDKGES